MNLAGLSLRILFGLGVAFVLAWLALVVFLSTVRPKGLVVQETLRLVPDSLRLLGRLAADRSLPKAVHIRLVLLLAYLALPFDIVPDFIPVIGYAENAILTALVLRRLVRHAGPPKLAEQWTGTAEGWTALREMLHLEAA